MIPDSESLSREYVQRLTDNYDAAAEARAERERWHTLYRLSTLIALVELETEVSLETRLFAELAQLDNGWEIKREATLAIQSDDSESLLR